VPNIPTFTAPFPSINVTDRGEQAFVQEAREIGTLGREGLRVLDEGTRQFQEGAQSALNTVSEHQQYQDRMTGIKTLADMKAQHVTQLGQIQANTSPDDMPNALAQFHQQVGDQTDQWQQQFAGSNKATQLWAQEQASEYKLQNAQKMAADSAINAGNKAVSDIAHTANSISATLSASPTPLEINSGLKLWDQATQTAASSPYLTTPEAKQHVQKEYENMRGQFVENAVYKAIENNPAIADTMIKQFGQYLSPQQQRAAQEHAQSMTQKQFWQNRAVEEDQRRQEKVDANKALTDLTRSTFSMAPGQNGGPMTPTGERYIPPDYFSRALEISKMPGADEGTLRSAVRDAQEILNRQKNGVIATTDPTTYQQLFQKSYNGLTFQDVANAHASGKLSDHDSAMFHQMVEDASHNPQMTDNKRQFETFINTYAKGLIMKSSMMDPTAWEAQRLQQFENDKWQQFQQGIAKGIPVYDMLDQRSKNFIGGNIQQYQLTPDQQLKALTDKAQGGEKPLAPVAPNAPPRNPGESLKDYDKRTGG